MDVSQDPEPWRLLLWHPEEQPPDWAYRGLEDPYSRSRQGNIEEAGEKAVEET